MRFWNWHFSTRKQMIQITRLWGFGSLLGICETHRLVQGASSSFPTSYLVLANSSRSTGVVVVVVLVFVIVLIFLVAIVIVLVLIFLVFIVIVVVVVVVVGLLLLLLLLLLVVVVVAVAALLLKFIYGPQPTPNVKKSWCRILQHSGLWSQQVYTFGSTRRRCGFP